MSGERNADRITREPTNVVETGNDLVPMPPRTAFIKEINVQIVYI
jgi:hypothetical protein